MNVTHKFISSKADSTDTTLVRPKNWNDPHDIKTAGDGVVLGRPVGAGPGDVLEISFSALMAALFLPGFCLPYAGATAPTGFLLCDGAAVSRTTYAALFAICGTAYGAGDGSSTFNVPDLRGRVVAGVDGGTNRLNALGNARGAVGGEQTHTLSVTEMPTHAHGVNDPGHQHNVPGANYYYDGMGTTQNLGGGGAASAQQGPSSGTGVSINNMGGGGGHNNVQPTMQMNYIIKT